MGVEGTERILQLLSLLSSRRTWTGTELAERLGTTGRTVRRDIDRLRMLGYQIDGVRGAAGGSVMVSLPFTASTQWWITSLSEITPARGGGGRA